MVQANSKWPCSTTKGRLRNDLRNYSMIRENRNNIWIFGGYATGVVLNDLFELNLEDLKWTEVPAFGSIPNAR